MNKIVLCKILIIISFSLCVAVVVFPVIIGLTGIMEYQELYITWIVILILCFLSTLVMVFFTAKYGVPETKRKVRNIHIKSTEYIDFLSDADRIIKGNKYEHIKNSNCDDIELNLYLKKSYFKTKLSVISIIKMSVLCEEQMSVANEMITEILEKYCNLKNNSSVNMISVFCVSRITDFFKAFMKEPVEQGIKNGRFIVGFSQPLGKILYLPPVKDSIGFMKYYSLKREFKKLFSFLWMKNNEPGSTKDKS